MGVGQGDYTKLYMRIDGNVEMGLGIKLRGPACLDTRYAPIRSHV